MKNLLTKKLLTKKLFSFLLGILLFIININTSMVSASTISNIKDLKNQTIVNNTMTIPQIIEIANENSITLNVDNLSRISQIQKQEIIDTVNTMYIESLTYTDNEKKILKNNAISPAAIDGSVKDKTYKTIVTGTHDIQGTTTKYEIEFWVPCSVYSDQSSRQILAVYDKDMNSFCNNFGVVYNHITGWSAIAPNKSYVVASASGEYTKAGISHRIITFSAKIYA